MLTASALLLASTLLGQSREAPRLPSRLEEAVALVAQGERGRQMLEVGALPAGQAEAIRQVLRDATSALESVNKEIQKELPLRRRSVAKADGLSADELSRLSEQVQYQLARASKNRGLLFEAGTDDRVSLLASARDTLERLMPQVPDVEPLKQQIQLDLAECHRLLGRYEEATRVAKALEREGAPTSTRGRARAERIRAAIGQKQLDDALTLAPQQADQPLSPELTLARFEAHLAMIRTLDRSSDHSRQLQQQAAGDLTLLEQADGAYWFLRACQQLTAVYPDAVITNPELLRRTADYFFLTSQPDKAIESYERAADQSKAAADINTEFEAVTKEALVEQKLGRHQAAASRLRTISLSHPAHPGAAQAHLLAAWNASQAAKSDEKSLPLYQELLREHLTHWPSGQSANQARQWLGTR